MKKFLKCVSIVGCVMASFTMAWADWQPNGPIKMHIGFGAGGTTDVSGRVVAKVIERQTGWKIVPENKPGGGGVAMLANMSKQKPDGQLIGLSVNVPLLMQLALKGEDKMPITLDSIEYLGTISRAPISLVASADAPYDTFAEFVAYAKNNTAKIAFDAPPQKFIVASVNKDNGTNIGLVPFKSSAETVPAVLGGHVDAAYAAGTHIEYVQSGRLKMLAAVTDDRHAYAPNVSTLKQQGIPYSLDPIYFFAVPKGVPADAKKALMRAIDNAIRDKEVIDVVQNISFVPTKNYGAQTKSVLMSNYQAVKAMVGKNK